AGGKIAIQAKVIRALIKDGLKLHLNAVGGVLLTVVNTLMINYYSSTEEVGWYQFASQMIATVVILPQALHRVLYEMTAESGPDQIWPDQKRILARLMGIMIVVILSIYFLSIEQGRSEEHTSELQSRSDLVCRLLLEKKK